VRIHGYTGRPTATVALPREDEGGGTSGSRDAPAMPAPHLSRGVIEEQVWRESPWSTTAPPPRSSATATSRPTAPASAAKAT